MSQCVQRRNDKSLPRFFHAVVERSCGHDRHYDIIDVLFASASQTLQNAWLQLADALGDVLSVCGDLVALTHSLLRAVPDVGFVPEHLVPEHLEMLHHLGFLVVLHQVQVVRLGDRRQSFGNRPRDIRYPGPDPKHSPAHDKRRRQGLEPRKTGQAEKAGQIAR